MIDKERIKESMAMISEHLIKDHDDGDENSLWCRFSEIAQEMERVNIEKEVVWKRYLATLTKLTEITKKK